MKIFEIKAVHPSGDEYVVHVNADLIEAVVAGDFAGGASTVIQTSSGMEYKTRSSVEHILKLMSRCPHCHETNG